MKISVIAPVLNEAPWIGYSILSALPYVHEFVYALDMASNDGTRELLDFIQHKYEFERLKVLDHPTFHPSDTKAYNGAFNACIEASTGDACFFLHPDMIVTKWNDPSKGPLAWWTNITSYAGDFQTKIVKGRADRWKNIHVKNFGLKYLGGYGSANEDFYHTLITGSTCKHYGTDFDKYPFEVANSGISVNHYCELKNYKRRFEKMKLCLKTQNPHYSDELIEGLASRHQRVTLETRGSDGSIYEYEKVNDGIPDVILKHKKEFEEIING